MEGNHQIPQLSATTLLILEREEQECQVFVLKRQNRGGFLGDALVFPGGVVEESDYAASDDPIKAAAVREITEETGLRLNIQDLHDFSWWLTPQFERRRFDTRFFVAPYPANQLPTVALAESQWGRLLAPSEILEMHERGELKLMPPTLLSLELICGLITFEEVLSKARHLSEPICPELRLNERGEPFLALPPQPYFGREGFAISPDGKFS